MKGTRAWERRKSTSICLVPWRLKCLENGKHDFCERSTSIAKWTMGTYSVDAKDAGKGEREKRFFFFTFPVIPTKIAPIALESLTNLLERA